MGGGEDETPKGGTCVYSAIQQPAGLSEEGNLALNWREWKSAFDYYLIAAGKENATSREKCALFLHTIGKYGRELLEEIDLSETEKQSYEVLVLKFRNHCDPTRNINYERHVFFETYQQEDTFDKYLGILKIKSKVCDFGTLRNSLILTQIIRGIKDTSLRERLLAKKELKLEDAVLLCRAAETASKQAEECNRHATTSKSGKSSDSMVEALRFGGGTSRGGRGRRFGRGRGRGRPSSASFGSSTLQPRPDTSANICEKCGRYHSDDERCSARNIKCYRCERVGHFAKMCKAKFVHETVEEEEEELCESLLYNLSLDSVDSSQSWWENIIVDGKKIKFKLDSGADVTVLSRSAFTEAGFCQNMLTKDKVVLREISRSKLPVLGYFEPTMSYKGVTTQQKIYVLDMECSNLLSLQACQSLSLIARIGELSQYNFDKSIFEGIGCLPNVCKIIIDKSVPPVVNASRKIPIKLRPRLKEELEKMEKMKIIVKEESPTDWVSNIVIVEKPDKKLRLCLDPCYLNKAVRRCHYQLPTLDEITSNLAGAKYFSKMDAKKGFWMLCLDDYSSKLCTFATPFGRYRFLRMPFGINCAPEIFHNEMCKLFSMPGVEVYCDDLLIWGETKQQHDDRLEEVIKRAKINGVKFNKDKCIFGQTEVQFLGHVFSSEGIRPDSSRVKAIEAIPIPKDKKDLERFLGITNYLARFIPNYSEVSAPLRELLKQSIEFNWCHTHDQVFKKLKNLISVAPVLRYYSPREEVTVSVDASSRGLGACLLQGGRPVAYAAAYMEILPDLSTGSDLRCGRFYEQDFKK